MGATEIPTKPSEEDVTTVEAIEATTGDVKITTEPAEDVDATTTTASSEITSAVPETTMMPLDEKETEEPKTSTEAPADPSVTDMITSTVKSITDLISTLSPKTSTDFVPTEASTALDSEITTVQTIIPL